MSIVVTTGHSSLRLAAAEQGRLLQVTRFGLASMERMPLGCRSG